MAFIIDKQTLDDLNIFGKRGRDSIYSMFNTTRTRGGARVLEEMFLYPLSEEEKINKRGSIIHFFRESGMTFPFRGELFDTIEYYLSNTDNRTRLSAEDNTLQRKLKGAMGADADYDQLHKGVLAAIEIIRGLRDFIEGMDKNKDAGPYRAEIEEMARLARDPELAPLLEEKAGRKLPYAKTAALDALLRFKVREKFLRLLHWIYNLDVYIAVAAVAARYGFVIAKALPGGNNTLKIKEVYHPRVKNAVANSLDVDRSNNVIFLTGANMAGKSTFMKTLGIAVYLAHVGLPVPARDMEFSVLEGMYTTINLPDNLNMGYSHFYAEVLRVKKVAEQLGRSKNLLVIFDELFRGTNVKDAYDATVAITEAFSGKRDCLFVISTHIIEAGETLGNACDNIHFVYFPTVMDGNIPRYTYTLADGVTGDRHGMMIINNEKVIEIIREEAPRDTTSPPPPFLVDKQTLEDLNMLGEFRPNSIFNIFNTTRTRGGKQLLEAIFQQPLNNATEINDRADILDYFREQNLPFPIDNDLFATVDHYFSNSSGGNLPEALFHAARRKLLHYIGADKEHEITRDGLVAAIHFIKLLRDFTARLAGGNVPAPYRRRIDNALRIFADKRLEWIFTTPGDKKWRWFDIARRDFTLRTRCRQETRDVMQLLHEFDAYLSIARAARERGLTRARAIPFEDDNNRIFIEEVYHPCIPRAVPNTIEITRSRNVIFLTGANMAGKSTLMKSFSIALYLAHAGLPVAARDMEFSVQDGLFTSINVADNLNMGYSHFYAEVLRVKHVAREVASGKNLTVVFDELFKGTNVKDAYDATVAVTDAYSNHRNCSFIISTHIIEAGHSLRDAKDNLQFLFVPTVMKDGVPTYPYRLKEGITDDRHGMIIINNERVVEIIKGQ